MIPPTADAIRFHSMRVFLQVQGWKSCASRLVAEEWGWKTKEGEMLPIQTSLPPAPIKLMEIIRYNCKAGCSTGRFTCKKHGLHCSYACGTCGGVSFVNSVPPSDKDSDSEEE